MGESDKLNVEHAEKRDPSTFDVTGDELLAYIVERCRSMRCPACGDSSQPTVSADSGEGPAHLSASNILMPKGYGARGYCTALCKHCAFVWHFDAAVILDWVVEKRTQGTDDEQ